MFKTRIWLFVIWGILLASPLVVNQSFARVSVTTYQQGGTQLIQVFLIGSDNHLHVNYWNGASWFWSDLGDPGTGAGLLKVSAITYWDGQTQRIYAFVTGTDGHLYVDYLPGGGWQWADLGTPGTGAGLFRLSAITYQQAGTQQIYVFITGTDGHLYLERWNGSSWQWTDQGAPPGSGTDGTLSAVTYQAGATQPIYAFTVGTNGHLYANYSSDGASWQWGDLGTPGVSVTGPSVITYWDGQTQRFFAFAVGVDDRRLYADSWDPGWHWVDLATGGAPICNVSAISLPAGATQLIYVFVCDQTINSNLYVDFWNGQFWQWVNLGNPGAPVTGPASITYWDGQIQRFYTFVQGENDGHLYVSYWAGAGWQWADQGTP